MKRIPKRLENWKGVYFSLGGRITIIQASLSSIPFCYLSLFKIPVGVDNSIEKIMKKLLLLGSREDKKDHPVSWGVQLRRKEVWV